MIDMTLEKDLTALRKWIKRATKSHRDKDARGFRDSLSLLYEFLDKMEDVIKYTDDQQLAYLIKQHNLKKGSK